MSGNEGAQPALVEAGAYLVRPIGRVKSTITDRRSAPRQADEGAPPATLVLDGSVQPAIRGLKVGDPVVILTWLHHARRDALLTHPRDDMAAPLQGVFSTRSPDRPNPIGLHTTTVVAIEGTQVVVQALEAVDGTPVLDIKPSLGPPGQR